MKTVMTALATALLGVAAASATSVATLRESTTTGLCDSVNSFAGYVDIDEATDKHYFYWFFESRNDPSNDPIILWMTGGPGCSSELALLFENGPCRLNSEGSDTYVNPYGWNKNANVIYIDQPAGTGFSYGDTSGYDHNEKQVANDMYTFLQGFFKKHSNFLSNDFYVFGESYGGHYVPATSHRVWMGNNRREGRYINLKGVSVGNGLTDPLVQYQFYAPMAYNYSISKIGKPRVDLQTYKSMVAAWPKCKQMIAQCQTDTNACPDAENYCNEAMLAPYEAGGWNPYDIRKQCKYRPLCYNFGNVKTWLQNSTVVERLGVQGHSWSVCNFVVNSGFSHDYMKNFQQYVSDLLGANIPIMIYAGDVDFICNWLGNKAWTLGLKWSGHDAFNKAADKPWFVDGKQVGEARYANGFSFVRVYNAGHMVPADQPEAALNMVNTFISGGHV